MNEWMNATEWFAVWFSAWICCNNAFASYLLTHNLDFLDLQSSRMAAGVFGHPGHHAPSLVALVSSPVSASATPPSLSWEERTARGRAGKLRSARSLSARVSRFSSICSPTILHLQSRESVGNFPTYHHPHHYLFLLSFNSQWQLGALVTVGHL